MNNPLWLIIAASIVALIPIAIGVVTSYVKVSVVLGMLRSGIGAQQVPSSLIIMVLSLSITTFIMAPVLNDTFEIASKVKISDFNQSPSLADLKNLFPLFAPWKAFMEKHAGEREIKSLSLIAEPSESAESEKREPSLRVLIPAFVLSELKEGFAMGFVLLLPFLAIDLIVGNILAGLGMHMLSPAMVSLPIKLILFVVSDGWILLTKGLINSYIV